MPITIDRRLLLQGAASLLLAPSAFDRARAYTATGTTQLFIDTRILDINGKAAKVYSLTQPTGIAGLETNSGSNFRVSLTNQLDHVSLIHWHGLTPPSSQDGVPDLSQSPLKPKETYAYDFLLERPGTYWMHSHVGLQEQKLLAAPLIVHDPAEAGNDEHNIVIMLHDFTFREPEEILHELRFGEESQGHGNMAMKQDGMAMNKGGMDMGSMRMGTMEMDLNDVEFDAYLANDRTLADPEIVRVELGARLRLRIINAAASTNFMIDLGALEGAVIAVDGQPVMPVTGKRFEIAIAQRLDIRMTLPPGQGAYPILAVREGNRARTGIILATPSGTIPKLEDEGKYQAPAIRTGLEQRLKAITALAVRPVDRHITLNLTGSMARYVWTLNDRVYEDRIPLMVVRDERVEIVMHNKTGMAHPMHLHGHLFQIVAINNQPLNGAMRDTVMVPPQGSVTIAFDADNPGRWAFHCHNLYHMGSGMFTSLDYCLTSALMGPNSCI